MSKSLRALAGNLRKSLWTALGMGVICAVWIGLSQVPVIPGPGAPVFFGPDGVLAFLEDRTIDARFNVRGSIPSPLKVAYVDVDTDSLTNLGNFPWNRAIFAEVIDAMFDLGGIRGIGFDFVFSATGIPNLGRKEAEEGSLILGRSVRRHGPVVLAASYGSEQSLLGKRGSFPFLFDPRSRPEDADLPELPSFPVVGPTWGRIGLIDVIGDDVRYVPFFAETEHQTYLALSLQLALIHYGLPARAVEITTDAIMLRAADGSIAARIPLWLRQFVEPNWFSPWLSEQNPRASVVTVQDYARLAREGTEEEKAEAAAFFAAFRDAIVLVGPTDPLLKDISPAPLNGGRPVPRVSLHGNLLKTIVGERYVIRPPVWANVLLITGLGLGVAGLSVLPRGGKFFACLAAVAYVAAAFALFARADVVVPLVAPLGAALWCSLLALVRQLSQEEARRRRIKDLFGSYVSSSVVDEIVENEGTPQTGGAEVEITAFFSDIASFTSIAEKLAPRDLVAMMSEYLAEGTSAITEAGGTLDKYVGDAIIAMFGAPLRRDDHAAAACRAALGVQEGQARLRRRWSEGNRAVPDGALRMRTRIGLNTGPAVVGNVGSPLRFNYTMMGATVNVASRLEAAVGHYGADIIVSEATAQAALRDDGELVFRPLDRIVVAGHHEGIEVLELLGRGGQAAHDHRARIGLYALARDLYREGRWAEAEEAFIAAAEHEPSIARINPCLVMARRCAKFRASGQAPVADFHLAKG